MKKSILLGLAAVTMLGTSTAFADTLDTVMLNVALVLVWPASLLLMKKVTGKVST